MIAAPWGSPWALGGYHVVRCEAECAPQRGGLSPALCFAYRKGGAAPPLGDALARASVREARACA